MSQKLFISHMLKRALSMVVNTHCTPATTCPVLDARKQEGHTKLTQSLGTLSLLPVTLANACDRTITSSRRTVVNEITQRPEGNTRRTVQLPGINGQSQETDINAKIIEYLSLYDNAYPCAKWLHLHQGKQLYLKEPTCKHTGQ